MTGGVILEKIKKFLLLIMLLIVIIIIMIISIILSKLKKEKDITVDEHESEYYNHGEEEKNTSLHILTNTNTFYTVESCINLYLDNITEYNKQKENIAKRMWEIDINDNVSIYYVYTKIRDKNTLDISNEDDFYCTVILDKYNNTFSIKINGKEYSENDLNAISKYSTSEVKLEGNNRYSEVIIYNEDIIKKYFNEYLKNVLYKAEIAYEMLDEEYRSKKFNNIGVFNEYVNNNKFNLVNSTILKYSVDHFDKYTQYTILDNNNNYYIIKENNVMDFSILLDNYTVETEKFNEEYSNATDNVKIATNIDKIFKMINNKEYKNIYEKYLNIGFKNNYFSNYQKFEEFINDKFFNYNYLGSTSVDKQNGYYVATVNYKDGISSAAESRVINIIMRLNQDNSFEFSFEM